MIRFFRYIVLQVYLLLVVCFSSWAQSTPIATLSPEAQVSLITCEPGEALFEAFGHSAIRVEDQATGIDMAYNYGVFDFNQPNFYGNFAKCYLLYKLCTTEFSRFRYQYGYFDRGVHEQVLNLTPAQKQAVYQFLEINNLPQNRDYYYDYFFDNCATRPRDVFISILGDSLQFDYGYADTLQYTIRGLIDHYIGDSSKHAWGDLGIDIGLGAKIDRLATPFEYMYQPEFLALAFEGATVLQPDGTRRPFVSSSHTLFQGQAAVEEAGFYFTPTFAFWLLLVLVAAGTAADLRRRKYRMRAFDVLFFAVLGLTGALIVFLWFFTNHGSAANNWNILWALPTHVVAGLLLLYLPYQRGLQRYFLATAVVSGILLLTWPLIPQDLHESLIPVVLMVILRSVVIYTGVTGKQPEQRSFSRPAKVAKSL
ncbi:DUF4105 domain-containing protein [soil metagenome]